MSRQLTHFNESALKVAYYEGAVKALEGVVEEKFNHDDEEFLKYLELAKIDMERAKQKLEKGPLRRVKARRRK